MMNQFSLDEALPQRGRAVFLLENFNDSLKNSLLYLSNICEEVVEKEILDTAVGKFQDLNTKEKLSPFLYSLNTRLVEAIKSEDLSCIKTIFQHLSSDSFNPFNKFQSFSKTGEYYQELFKHYALHDLPYTPEFLPLDDDKFQKAQGKYNHAEEIIRKGAPELAEEADSLISQYFIFESDIFRSGSSFNMFGMIFSRHDSRMGTLVEIVDKIIHEAAHLYLYLLLAQDPLTLNAPEERFVSPLRADPRPMSGIYHATFVLARIILGLEQVNEKQLFPVNEQEKYQELVQKYRERYQVGMDIITESAQLSDLGKNLIESTTKLAA